MEYGDADGSHHNPVSVLEVLGIGDIIPLPVIGHTLQLEVAVMVVTGRESQLGQEVGTDGLHLLFGRLHLLLQQLQLGTEGDALVQRRGDGQGDDGVRGHDFRVQVRAQHVAQGEAAEVGAVFRLLQLIVYLAPLGLDAQQVVGRGHARRHADLRLVVEGVHLPAVGLQHPHFPADGDVGPIGVVGIGQHLHPRLAPVLGRTIPADGGQAVARPDLAAGVERLRQGDARHVRPVHLERHPTHHVHVGPHIDSRGSGIGLGQVGGEGNGLVQLGPAHGVVRLLQVFVVGQGHLATLGQGERQEGILSEGGRARNRKQRARQEDGFQDRCIHK